MECFLRLLATQAMIPEMPVLCNEAPTWSIFVERVGHIDRRNEGPARAPWTHACPDRRWR
jgi:hypothetical protein